MPPRRSLLPREPLLRVALLPPPTPPPDDDEGDTAQPAAPAEPPPAPALPPPAPIGRILEQARPEAATLACACVFLAAGAALNLALPYLAGQLIDACSGAATSKADPPAGGGGGGGDWDPAAAVQRINQLLLRLVAVVAAGAVTGATRSYLFNAAAERIVARLRARLFRQVISQEVGFFDAARSGELLSRLSEDVRAMRDAATSTLSSALSSGATVAAGIALMGATSWRLTLCVLCTLPVPIGALIAFARANRAVMVKQLAASAAASAAAEEALGALRTVRSFAQEDAVAARYSARLRETLRQGLRGAAIGAALSGVVGPLTTGSLVFVLWVGARQVIAGTLSVGELNSFMLYALYVGASAGALGGVFAQLTTAAGAGARVFELLDRTPLLPPSGSEAPAAPPGGGASLALKRVWFSYPSRPSVWVLRGFDLAIAPRQRVALVGSSGGGKSTVAALVQRYYDPARGEVLLDGAPVRLWDHRALHRAVAMVAQEPTLFAESILYNIIFPYLAVDGAAVWSSGGGGGGGGAQAAAKRWSGWRRPRGDGGAKAGGAAALAAPGADEEQPLLPGEAVASSANGGGAADGESHPPAAAAAHSAGAAVPGLDASLLAQLAPGLSVEDVVAAAKAAHAHDFICALPEGYSTPVGERGVRLSGGQKQRVAIARALLLRPRLLLLDEATSALDAESEHQVQAALDEAAQGRSVLVIAHRLSTVRDADAVAVVAGGRVEELGTHTELLAKGGAYAALVRRQLLGSGADAGGGTGGGGTHGGAAVAQHSSAGGGGGGENGSSDVGVVDTPAV